MDLLTYVCQDHNPDDPRYRGWGASGHTGHPLPPGKTRLRVFRVRDAADGLEPPPPPGTWIGGDGTWHERHPFLDGLVVDTDDGYRAELVAFGVSVPWYPPSPTSFSSCWDRWWAARREAEVL